MAVRKSGSAIVRQRFWNKVSMMEVLLDEVKSIGGKCPLAAWDRKRLTRTARTKGCSTRPGIGPDAVLSESQVSAD